MLRLVALHVCTVLLLVGLICSVCAADSPGGRNFSAAVEPASFSSTAAESTAAFTGQLSLSTPAPGRRLQASVTVRFDERPLSEALRFLAQRANVPLWIDTVSLAEEGIAPHARVSADLRNVSVETALHRILLPLELTSFVEDEILIVTTETSAAEHLRTGVLNVERLLDHASRLNRRAARRTPGLGFGADDWDTPGESWIFDVLYDATSGQWEEIEGFGGTGRVAGGRLILRQTPQVLAEVRQLLQALELAVTGQLKYGSTAVRPRGYPWQEDRQIDAALSKRLNARYEDQPLERVLDALAERFGIAIWIDRVALIEEGISTDEPITVHLENVTLRSLLTLMFRPLGLTFYVDRGALVVTTETEAENRLVTVVHDVRDLNRNGIDQTTLIDAIQSATSGEWEEIDGIGGTVQMPFPGTLVVRQTHRVLGEIEVLLSELRRGTDSERDVQFKAQFPSLSASSSDSASSPRSASPR